MNRKPNKKRNLLVLVMIIALLVLLWLVCRMSLSNYAIYEEYAEEYSVDATE